MSHIQHLTQDEVDLKGFLAKVKKAARKTPIANNDEVMNVFCPFQLIDIEGVRVSVSRTSCYLYVWDELIVSAACKSKNTWEVVYHD